MTIRSMKTLNVKPSLLAVAAVLSIALPAPSIAQGNFTTGTSDAAKFGVHEITLAGDGAVANPFDTVATVVFTTPSGLAKTVEAFFDGENTWRARVYVSEPGAWQWASRCATDGLLDGKRGGFTAAESKLRGRLLPHPKNPRQWMTEDGRWFLNLSDTAYFLLSPRDGNGGAVSDEDALRYVRSDVAHGITSLRCFLTAGEKGFNEAARVWDEWFFADTQREHLRLGNLQCADRRLRLLLEQYPDVAVQLILFPLEAYARDDRFWAALSPARRERLLRQIVARYAAYPQIFWMLVNDAHYGEKFPQSNAMVREVGAWLKQNDPWQHPRSTGHARGVPFHFGGEDWATYIHIEHKHDLGAQEYGRYHAYAKPVFLGEDRYEQDHGPRLDPMHMREWQRRLFWAWLLSGGSTNYGGRWWAVQPYAETGARATTYHKRPAVTFTQPLTGLDSVKAIRDYFPMRQIDLGEFQPDHALAGAEQSGRAPKVMRRRLDEFLVYHPNAAEDGQGARVDPAATAKLRLDLRTANGDFQVEWYRAEDGQAQPQGHIQGGDFVELRAPWAGKDVVLRLLRESAAGAGSARNRVPVSDGLR